MSKEKKNKKKKVKTVYIDDGSTIADMSGIDRARPRAFGSRPDSSKTNSTDKGNTTLNNGVYTGNKFKDSFRTYIATVKLMIVPMLITMGIISAAFFILWLLMTLAS